MLVSPLHISDNFADIERAHIDRAFTEEEYLKFKQTLATMKPYREAMSAEVMTVVRRQIDHIVTHGNQDQRVEFDKKIDVMSKYNHSLLIPCSRVLRQARCSNDNVIHNMRS
jgi:hypothetical protein